MEQINLLGQIDRFEMEKTMQIMARLEREYEAPNFTDHLPEGLVIIARQDLFRDGKYHPHFYRTVLGYHHTVACPHEHIIWQPDEEWPDEPVWGGENPKQRWIYPGYDFRFFTKGEIVEPVPLL